MGSRSIETLERHSVGVKRDVSLLFISVVLVKARNTLSRISSLAGQSTSALSGFRCIWNKHGMPPIPLFASSEYRDDGYRQESNGSGSQGHNFFAGRHIYGV